MLNYCIIFLFLVAYFIQCQSWCWYNRCCLDNEKIIQGLESNFSRTLFGQHLVVDPILSALASHLDHVPRKALVLSFHGPAGVGKTFVAKKIAHHLFNGENYHVKFYSGTFDFADNSKVDEHREKLAKEIKENVRKCGSSIFIFDEAHKMSDGLFDTLRPFTEFYDEYQGVDYRRAVFIFISNIGASELSDIYFIKKETNKFKREDLKLNDFEEILSMYLFHKRGGFKDSALVVNFLVDYYIPFLPLEKEHIELCISRSMEENNFQPNPKIIKQIYDTLPKKKKGNIEYIASNCKRVGTEMGMFLQKIKRQQRNSRRKDEM